MFKLVISMILSLAFVACSANAGLPPQATDNAASVTPTRCATPTRGATASAGAAAATSASGQSDLAGGTPVAGRRVQVTPGVATLSPDAQATHDALWNQANKSGPDVETAVVPESGPSEQGGDTAPGAGGTVQPAPPLTPRPGGGTTPLSPNGVPPTPHLSPNNGPDAPATENPCP